MKNLLLEREYRDCIKSRRDKIGITRHIMMHQVLYIVQLPNEEGLAPSVCPSLRAADPACTCIYIPDRDTYVHVHISV